MEPEGSLPFHNRPPLDPILSQTNPVQAIWPDFFKMCFLLSSHLRLGVRNVLFQDLPLKSCILFSTPSYVPHTLPI